MPYYLSPVLNDQQFDANGDPLAGGKIETYLAGTVTPVITYKTSTGTAQANPIVLDAAGEMPTGTQLWLLGGQTYKFVLMDSTSSVIRTYDNVTGINDVTTGGDEYVLFSQTPTFVSTVSFTLPGDVTQTFLTNRRVKTLNTGGTIYSTVVTSVYSAPNTTITVSNDSGVLDVGLSAVSYAFLSSSNRSSPENIRVTVASAATVDLSAIETTNIDISGTTTITAFTIPNGRTYLVRFTDATTITNNAAIVTQRGANIVTTSGATCLVRATATNVVEILCYVAKEIPAFIYTGTSQASTAGTSIDFTALPSGTKQIVVSLVGVSTSGTDNLLIQLGDSGGIENSGYLCGTMQANGGGGSTVTSSNSTAGFVMRNLSGATSVIHGSMIITLVDSATNTWAATWSFGSSDVASALCGGGSKSTSATLDRVRITTTGGANTFDAGLINISYIV